MPRPKSETPTTPTERKTAQRRALIEQGGINQSLELTGEEVAKARALMMTLGLRSIPAVLRKLLAKA